MATPPSITTQPQAVTVNAGQPATFSVVATGTAPLTYQWQMNNTAVAGATGSSYTISAAPLSDSGASLTVTVSNAAGNVLSNAVKLTVNPVVAGQKPTITTQPTNQAAAYGATATFTVQASGATTYQWTRGGANISGATGPTYTTPALDVTYIAAVYAVVVSNSFGSVTSANAKLAVTHSLALLAGGLGGIGHFDGVGVSATFFTPANVATDTSGNVYVADTANNIIRKIDHTSGQVSTLAGTAGVVGSTDATGAAASFNSPGGLAVDSSTGNVYVADSQNDTIRMITAAGVVTTLAGSPGSSGFADGTGSIARFAGPSGVAVNSATHHIYVADSNNEVIRDIAPGAVVTTLAGTHGTSGSRDGTSATALFNQPLGVAVDPASGNVYVADYLNSTIRKITPAPVVQASFTASTAGTVLTVSAISSGTIAVGQGLSGTGVPAGTYISALGTGLGGIGTYTLNTSSTIASEAMTTTSSVTTLAGTAGSFGYADGPGSGAIFNGPLGLALDSTGANLYVADAGNATIRQVTTAGAVVTTLAGTAGHLGYADGSGAAASFSNPSGVATDASGNVFVADSDNNEIRMVTTPGAAVSTYAGSIGGRGYLDQAWVLAKFNDPHNIAMDAAGNTYVGDLGNNVIRFIAAGGSQVTTFAGSVGPGGVGSADGTGAAAKFNGPVGMVTDSHGNLFVSDYNNNTIRKITPSGVVTTFAGTAGAAGCNDGTGSAARFTNPYGLAIDASDNIYVADYGNQVIRMITPGGVVSRLAATCTIQGFNDGPALANGQFNGPHGVAVDRSTGNVYVADRFNNAIRMISGGVVTTIAGPAATGGATPGASGFADGTGNAALFNWPGALAVDRGTGDVYVADYNNNAIRRVIPSSGAVTTVVGIPPNTSPAPVGVVVGALPGALSGPTSIVVTPRVPAQNIPLQLSISDSRENALLLATLP
jgi:DNA-binding beta-propeller fold protein YncE